MKITALEKQKGNKDRLNLFLEGSFCCGIDVGSAASLGLYEGKDVLESEIIAIGSEDSYQKCMNNALDLVTRRLQSERELWQKLSKKHEKPTIRRCINRLRELGYANDAAFAAMWVRERSNTRGSKLLAAELKLKGIEKSIIETALASVDLESVQDSATRLAIKKYKPMATSQENYTRVIGLLTRKGYDYSLSKQVLDEIIRTHT